jgi:hypothetical protein
MYKAINLLGDGKIASEYKLFPEPSVINNNTQEVDDEFSEDVIVSEETDPEKTDNWEEENNDCPIPF